MNLYLSRYKYRTNIYRYILQCTENDELIQGRFVLIPIFALDPFSKKLNKQ